MSAEGGKAERVAALIQPWRLPFSFLIASLLSLHFSVSSVVQILFLFVTLRGGHGRAAGHPVRGQPLPGVGEKGAAADAGSARRPHAGGAGQGLPEGALPQ